MKYISIVLFSASILMGCAATTPYATYEPIEQNNVLESSLFNNPDRTISEEDIKKILSSKIELKDSLRIAMVNYSYLTRKSRYSRYYSGMYDELVQSTQQNYVEAIQTKIEDHPKAARLFNMPMMMIGENANVYQLRETSVRMQADLLLVYAIQSDIYYRYRSFKSDEAKAYATVELFILDNYTGIIPFSSISTNSFKDKKGKEDVSNEEFRIRVENEAVLLALNEVITELDQFLSTQ